MFISVLLTGLFDIAIPVFWSRNGPVLYLVPFDFVDTRENPSVGVRAIVDVRGRVFILLKHQH